MISEVIFKREKKIKYGKGCTEEKVLSSNKQENGLCIEGDIVG